MFKLRVTFLFCLVSSILILSCKKDNNSPNTKGSNITQVQFTIAGLNEQEAELGAPAGSAIQAAVTDNLNHSRYHAFTEDGLEVTAVVNTVRGSVGNNIPGSKVASASAHQKLAATSPMPAGSSYWLLLFDDQGNFVSKGLATSGGTPLSFPVSSNKVYKWYAVSGTRANELIDYDSAGSVNWHPEQHGNVSVDGLLWATGSITTQTGINQTQVLFQRKQVMVEVRVDTRETYTKPSSNPYNSIRINGVRQTGTFNLFTGKYTALGDTTTVIINPSSLNDSLAVFQAYHITDGNPANINIRNPRTFTVDDSGSGVYLPKFVSPVTITATTGTKYIVNINLAIGGWQISANGQNFRVAPTDLYFALADKAFRIHQLGWFDSMFYPWDTGLSLADSLQNLYTDNDKDVNGNYRRLNFNRQPVNFFNANMKFPYLPFAYWKNPGGSAQYMPANYLPKPNMILDGRGDPCSLVKPYGRWRLPNKADAQALVLQYNNGGSADSRYNGDGTVKYFTRQNRQTAIGGNGDGPNDFYNGQITNPALTAGLDATKNLPFWTIDLPEPYYFTQAKFATSGLRTLMRRFWTSEQAPADPNHPSEKRYWAGWVNDDTDRRPFNRNGWSYKNYVESTSTSAYFGVKETPEHWGLSVRCIRNVN